MKVPAKSASSPARTDKFPPPFMSFMKSNAGSKSSGRSRSSPMFVKKKSSAIETQEPSSPKVTCMGQVRTRKASKQDQTQTTHKCPWIPAAFFCLHFSDKTKRKGWTSGFHLGLRRKSVTGEDSSANNETVVAGRTENTEEEEEDAEENDMEKGFVPFVYSPPKNAMILTRSRSAPYRSSSLAGRFYGSPLVTENRAAEEKTELEKTEIQKPEPPGDSASDQERKRSEEKIRFSKQVEESISECIRKLETREKVKTGEQEKEVEVGGSSRPPTLTRSKSDPSRIAETLSPESNSRKIGIF